MFQECSFIRCIKPNQNQWRDQFDEKFVLSQLISSCCFAYHQLMRTGFPSYLDIADIFDLFKQSLEQSEHTLINRKYICSELIRACGLRWKDFKLGNTKIFFRNGKLDVLTEKLKGDLNFIINRHKKLKLLRAKWRIVIIVTRLCSIWKNRSIRNGSIVLIENASVEEHGMERLDVDKACPKISREIKSNTNLKNKPAGKSNAIAGVKSFQRMLSATQITNRSTIAIHSTSEIALRHVGTGERLRNLLRQEKEENAELHNDYRKLQKRNLDLMEKLNDVQCENDRLVGENKKLKIAIETSRNNTLSDHSY